jgi:hypothetical protein
MNSHKTSYSLLQKNEYNEERSSEVYPVMVHALWKTPEVCFNLQN